jgi:ESCRT-II complex subunit VPS22
MRRRPGIAGLQRDVNARAQYRATGEEVRKATAAEMAAQLALFRTRLERFAADHKAEVRADPAFRAQFHAMCASVGVDPLASGKSLWAELLGLGDYYYELGVTVLEACLASRPHNGGLMELGALRCDWVEG